MVKLTEYSRFANISEDCWQIGISPDGGYLAVAYQSHPDEIQLCDLNGKSHKVLAGHKGKIHSIAFAGDGRTLVSGSADKTVRIWTPTGDLLVLFDRLDHGVECVGYSPRVPIIAIGLNNGNIVTIDIAGNYIATLQSPKNRVYCVDWSSDNNLLAAACADRRLYVFDAKNQTKRAYEHPGAVYGVSFSKTNGKLVTSCEDGAVRFISIAENKTAFTALHKGRTVGVAFSPDDRYVAAASFDKTVTLYDRYGNVRASEKIDSEALGIAFSPDTKRLFVTTKDHNLIIFDIVN